MTTKLAAIIAIIVSFPLLAAGPGRPAADQGPPTWTSGQYLYDGSGNIYAIGTAASPNGDGQFTTYTYDQASRLATTSVQTAAGVVRSEFYQVDVYGNLLTATAKNGSTLHYSVDGANRLTGAGIAYDTAGNLTSYAGETYSWDPAGMMTGKDHDTTWHDLYLYTADDERIGVRVGDTWTWSFRDGPRVLRQFQSSYTDAAAAWTWTEDYVYGPRGVAAAKLPSGDRYFHLDHLGTPRMITNAAGSSVAQRDDSPYGIELTTSSLAEAKHFTGHERDTNPPLLSTRALDYMHARYYSATEGRFLSVDPVVGDSRVPQSWNRYAYVKNDPVNRVDPDGRADLRTATDIAILESPAVLLATGEAAASTRFEDFSPNRKEFGFIVTNGGNGTFGTESVLSSEKNRQKDFMFQSRRGRVTRPTTSMSNHVVAATVHTHPGVGYVFGTGPDPELMTRGASKADKTLSVTSAAPVYIVQDTTSLIRVVNGRATEVLTGPDYTSYMQRAAALSETKKQFEQMIMPHF